MAKKFKKIKEYRLDYGGFSKKNTKFIYYFLGFLIILLLLNNIFFIRFFSARQIDDVNPSINCIEESYYFNKSDILMIVPIFEGKSIASNPSWCASIRQLNKTLGMHGVYHTYNEFNELRNESYVKLGMEEFKKCFGEYPQYFEAPQLSLSSENKKIIQGLNMNINGYGFNIFHKVYHCSDKGKYSNKAVDLV